MPLDWNLVNDGNLYKLVSKQDCSSITIIEFTEYMFGSLRKVAKYG